MTTADFLAYGNSHFEYIDSLIGQPLTADKYIRETPPPQEWLVSFPSLLNSEEVYYTIPIQILEQAMYRIYGEWRIKNVYTPEITHEKGRVAVTVTITVWYKKLDQSDGYLQGVASEFASGIQYLPLLTPKAVTSAKKNAFKQLGALFGGELNRTLDEIQFEYKDETPEKPEIKRAKALIDTAKTLDDLGKIKMQLPIGDKEIDSYYANKVKQLANG
jgi:hypothetical protein